MLRNVNIGTRTLFGAGEGTNLVVCDFGGQETKIAAALSKDKAMLTTFFIERDNPFIIHPDTKEKCVNPDSDLHIQAALQIPRFAFLKQVPPWELYDISKQKLADGSKPRQVGKLTNFTVIYGGMAARVAGILNSSPEEAQIVLDNYFLNFHGLKVWLENQSKLSRYQGWVTDAIGRKLFVAESNAKGIEDSVERKGPNALVQGLGSSMIKIAAYNIVRLLDQLNEKYYHLPPARLLALVHDEAICEVPGSFKLIDMKKNEDDVYEPVYEFSEESKEYGRLIAYEMEKAMSNILSPLVEQDFPSTVTPTIGRTWAAK